MKTYWSITDTTSASYNPPRAARICGRILPLVEEDDRYNAQDKSSLKKVHKRNAFMRIGEQLYRVK